MGAKKRVRKSKKKIAKYTTDYNYYAKELLPKWTKAIPLAKAEIPKIKLYFVKGGILSSRMYLTKMRKAFTHAKESNDDERLEYTRKWVNQAKFNLYKSLVNRVKYFRDYGATLNKKLEAAIKVQKT